MPTIPEQETISEHQEKLGLPEYYTGVILRPAILRHMHITPKKFHSLPKKSVRRRAPPSV